MNITGNGFVNGGVAIISDAQFKTQVESMDGALALIDQLTTHRYAFTAEAQGWFGLPAGEQIGLIAQEVEAVLPGLVRSNSLPERVDSLGNVLRPAMEILGLDYTGLVPILLAAVQEQNATITALQQQVTDGQAPADQLAAMQEQIALMQEQLAACCAGGGMLPEPEQRNADGTISGNARALSINPNPFIGQTTLTYTLERSGRMQLLANSADGKELRTLEQADMEAGQYTYVWNTSDLAPGIYYVTLLLDGEPIVKKAVRVRE